MGDEMSADYIERNEYTHREVGQYLDKIEAAAKVVCDRFKFDLKYVVLYHARLDVEYGHDVLLAPMPMGIPEFELIFKADFLPETLYQSLLLYRYAIDGGIAVDVGWLEHKCRSGLSAAL